VRLWVMSDLHLELTRGWDLPSGDTRPEFDVMVVAGDLIPKAERGVRWLLERVPDRPVIYLLGNHESYGTDIDRTLEKAKAAAAGTCVHVVQDDATRCAARGSRPGVARSGGAAGLRVRQDLKKEKKSCLS
jgi:predicted phosphodiesterase